MQGPDYLKLCAEWLASIKAQAEATTNTHHRAILENYYRHVALEYTPGRWIDIFNPKMTVDQPTYRIALGGENEKTVVLDGADSVKAFYDHLELVMDQDERLAVGDWGFASHSIINFFGTGSTLEGRGGATGLEPDGPYVVGVPVAMFWNYDSDARLQGEEVYQIGPATVTEQNPETAVTWEQRAEVASPYLPDW